MDAWVLTLAIGIFLLLILVLLTYPLKEPFQATTGEKQYTSWVHPDFQLVDDISGSKLIADFRKNLKNWMQWHYHQERNNQCFMWQRDTFGTDRGDAAFGDNNSGRYIYTGTDYMNREVRTILGTQTERIGYCDGGFIDTNATGNAPGGYRWAIDRRRNIWTIKNTSYEMPEVERIGVSRTLPAYRYMWPLMKTFAAQTKMLRWNQYTSTDPNTSISLEWLNTFTDMVTSTIMSRARYDLVKQYAPIRTLAIENGQSVARNGNQQSVSLPFQITDLLAGKRETNTDDLLFERTSTSIKPAAHIFKTNWAISVPVKDGFLTETNMKECNASLRYSMFNFGIPGTVDSSLRVDLKTLIPYCSWQMFQREYIQQGASIGYVEGWAAENDKLIRSSSTVPTTSQSEQWFYDTNDIPYSLQITPTALALMPYHTRKFVSAWITSRRKTLVSDMSGAYPVIKDLAIVKDKTAFQDMAAPTNVPIKDTEFLNSLAQQYYKAYGGKRRITQLMDACSIGNTIVDIRCNVQEYNDVSGNEIQQMIDLSGQKYIMDRYNSRFRNSQMQEIQSTYYSLLYSRQYEQSIVYKKSILDPYYESTYPGTTLRFFLGSDSKTINGFAEGPNAALTFNRLYNSYMMLPDKDSPGTVNYYPKTVYNRNPLLQRSCETLDGLRWILLDYTDNTYTTISGELVKGGWNKQGTIQIESVVARKQLDASECVIVWNESVYDENNQKIDFNATANKVVGTIFDFFSEELGPFAGLASAELDKQKIYTRLKAGFFRYSQNQDQWMVKELIFDPSGFHLASALNLNKSQNTYDLSFNPLPKPTESPFTLGGKGISLTRLATPIKFDKPLPDETTLDDGGVCPTLKCDTRDLSGNYVVLDRIVDQYNNDYRQPGIIHRIISAETPSPFQCDLLLDMDYSANKPKPLLATDVIEKPEGVSGITRETRSISVLLDPVSCKYNAVDFGDHNNGYAIQPKSPYLDQTYKYSESAKSNLLESTKKVLNAAVAPLTGVFDTLSNAVSPYRINTVATIGDMGSLFGCPSLKCSNPLVMEEAIRKFSNDNWKGERIKKIIAAGTLDPYTCDYTIEKENLGMDLATKLPKVLSTTISGIRCTMKKDPNTCYFTVDSIQYIQPYPVYADLAGPDKPTSATPVLDYVNTNQIVWTDCKSTFVLNKMKDFTFSSGGYQRDWFNELFNSNYSMNTKPMAIMDASNIDLGTCSFDMLLTSAVSPPTYAREVREYRFEKDANNQLTLARNYPYRDGPLGTPITPMIGYKLISRKTPQSDQTGAIVKDLPALSQTNPSVVVDCASAAVKALTGLRQIKDTNSLSNSVCEYRLVDISGIPFQQAVSRVEFSAQSDGSLLVNSVKGGDLQNSKWAYKPMATNPVLLPLFRKFWDTKYVKTYPLGHKQFIIDKIFRAGVIGPLVIYECSMAEYDEFGNVIEYYGGGDYAPLKYVSVLFRQDYSSSDPIYVSNIYGVASSLSEIRPFYDGPSLQEQNQTLLRKYIRSEHLSKVPEIWTQAFNKTSPDPNYYEENLTTNLVLGAIFPNFYMPKFLSGTFYTERMALTRTADYQAAKAAEMGTATVSFVSVVDSASVDSLARITTFSMIRISFPTSSIDGDYVSLSQFEFQKKGSFYPLSSACSLGLMSTSTFKKYTPSMNATTYDTAAKLPVPNVRTFYGRAYDLSGQDLTTLSELQIPKGWCIVIQLDLQEKLDGVSFLTGLDNLKNPKGVRIQGSQTGSFWKTIASNDAPITYTIPPQSLYQSYYLSPFFSLSGAAATMRAQLPGIPKGLYECGVQPTDWNVMRVVAKALRKENQKVVIASQTLTGGQSFSGGTFPYSVYVSNISKYSFDILRNTLSLSVKYTLLLLERDVFGEYVNPYGMKWDFFTSKDSLLKNLATSDYTSRVQIKFNKQIECAYPYPATLLSIDWRYPTVVSPLDAILVPYPSTPTNIPTNALAPRGWGGFPDRSTHFKSVGNWVLAKKPVQNNTTLNALKYTTEIVNRYTLPNTNIINLNDTIYYDSVCASSDVDSCLTIQSNPSPMYMGYVFTGQQPLSSGSSFSGLLPNTGYLIKSIDYSINSIVDYKSVFEYYGSENQPPKANPPTLTIRKEFGFAKQFRLSVSNVRNGGTQCSLGNFTLFLAQVEIPIDTITIQSGSTMLQGSQRYRISTLRGLWTRLNPTTLYADFSSGFTPQTIDWPIVGDTLYLTDSKSSYVVSVVSVDIPSSSFTCNELPASLDISQISIAKREATGGAQISKATFSTTSPLVFQFSMNNPVIFDSYQLSTSPTDGAEFDPIRWKLESTVNGTTWTVIHDLTEDAPVPTKRNGALQTNVASSTPTFSGIALGVKGSGQLLSECSVAPNEYRLLQSIVARYNKPSIFSFTFLQTMMNQYTGSFEYGLSMSQILEYAYDPIQNAVFYKVQFAVQGPDPTNPSKTLINPALLNDPKNEFSTYMNGSRVPYFSIKQPLAPLYSNNFTEYIKVLVNRSDTCTSFSIAGLYRSWTPFVDQPPATAFTGLANIPTGQDATSLGLGGFTIAQCGISPIDWGFIKTILSSVKQEGKATTLNGISYTYSLYILSIQKYAYSPTTNTIYFQTKVGALVQMPTGIAVNPPVLATAPGLAQYYTNGFTLYTKQVIHRKNCDSSPVQIANTLTSFSPFTEAPTLETFPGPANQPATESAVGWGGFSLETCGISANDWSVVSALANAYMQYIPSIDQAAKFMYSYQKADGTYATVAYRRYLTSISSFAYDVNTNTAYYVIKPTLVFEQYCLPTTATTTINTPQMATGAISGSGTASGVANYYTNNFVQYLKVSFQKSDCSTVSVSSLTESWTPFPGTPTTTTFADPTKVPTNPVAPIGWGGFSLDICAIPPTDWSILSQILSSYNKANQTLAIGSVVYRYGIYIASLKQFKFVSNSNTLHFQFKPIILVSGTPPPNNRIINPVAFSSNPTLAPYYTNQFLQYGKAVFSKTLCDTPASLTSLQVSWTPFSDMPTLSAFPGATNIPAGTVFPTGWGGVKEPQTMRAKYVLLRPTKSRSSTTNYSLGKVNFYRGTTKLTRADLKVPVATFINTTYNPVDTTKGTTLVDVSGRFFRSPTSTEYNIVQKQKDLDNAIAAYNFAKANDPWSYAGVMGPTLIRYAENYLAQALNANGPIFKDNPFYCNWYLTPAQQAAWNRPNDPGVETLFPYIDANLGDFSIVDKLVITNGSTTTEFGIQQFNITWPTGSRSPLAFLPSVVNPFPPAIIVSSCLSIPYSNFYVDGSTNNLFTIKKKVPAYLPNQNPNALLNYGATDFFNVPNQNFSVLFSFNSDVEFDGMSFTTAPGTDRSADLTQWTIECSSDGKTWKPFMTQSTPYSTPNAASTETEVFPYTVITESFANPTANPTLALPFVERPEVLRAVKEYLNRKKVRFEPASYSYHPTTGECQYILEDESIVSIVFTVDGLIDEAASNPRPIKFRGSNQALMLPSRGPVLQEVAAQAPEPTPFSFKHYRIRFLETRDPRAAYVHLGLLRAYDVHKQPIDLRAQGAKITNLLGAPAVDGTSAQVLLSPKGGRWTDTTRSPLQITFPEPTPLRALSFAMPSVPNSSAYDPVRWRVEASESGRHWVPVGEYSYVPSETRGAETPLFVFNYSA